MRGIQQMPGLKDIKSIHSIGARSIPKVQRSSYLELYILRREKDRLEKEVFALDKRKTDADRQLNSIVKRIEKLPKETHEEQKVKTYRGISARPLKTMAIKY
jgi:hypothetical protein